QKI
ncbi:hypothetical protein BV092_01248B, partial [Haemophilus influenzae]